MQKVSGFSKRKARRVVVDEEGEPVISWVLSTVFLRRHACHFSCVPFFLSGAGEIT